MEALGKASALQKGAGPIGLTRGEALALAEGEPEVSGEGGCLLAGPLLAPVMASGEPAKLERPELGVRTENVVSLTWGLHTRGLWAESSPNSILKLGKLQASLGLSGFITGIPKGLATPGAPVHMAAIWQRLGNAKQRPRPFREASTLVCRSPHRSLSSCL